MAKNKQSWKRNHLKNTTRKGNIKNKNMSNKKHFFEGEMVNNHDYKLLEKILKSLQNK